MITLSKATKGSQWAPGKRRYVSRYWDAKANKWRHVYPEDLEEKRRYHRAIAFVVLGDGTRIPIHPEKTEVGKDGKLIGGQKAVREILNRELFGDYGFYPKDHPKHGEFWHRKGILFDYKLKTSPTTGRIVVEKVQLRPGFAAIEYGDKSVARAYGKGLPQKILDYQLTSGDVVGTERAPEKPDPTPIEGTSDVPIENLDTIRDVPPTKVATAAVGAPLKNDEDALAIASAYLDMFLSGMRPSKAKTEAGQAKARAKRKGQFDMIVGARHLKPLPAWAINKFDFPEHLQRELSRDDGGKPLSTLITLGLWNKDVRAGRAREQLVSEWNSELRYHVRRMADAFKLTDTYNKLADDDEKHGHELWSPKSLRKQYLRDREHDLYQIGVKTLLEEAQNYQSNDDPDGPSSRFDKKARSSIMTAMSKWSRATARLQGAKGIVPDELEEMAAQQQGPHYTLSPQEHYELREYGPIARKIIRDAIADLPPEVQTTFKERLWLEGDDVFDAEESPEAEKFYTARLKQARKKGRATDNWGRPWTSIDAARSKSGVRSIADRLRDVPTGGKSGATIGDLTPGMQRYYLKEWYKQAENHLKEKLKSKTGGLTPDGAVVERWLRLEAKLAHANRRAVNERTEHPVVQMPLMNKQVQTHLRKEHIGGRPEVKFFRTPGSNQDLGVKLGILKREMDAAGNPKHVDLFEDYGHRHVTQHKQSQRMLDLAEKHYKHIERAKALHPAELRTAHESAKKDVEHAEKVGHWVKNDRGNVHWDEKSGVVALHEAANALIGLQTAKSSPVTDAKRDEAARKFADAANVVKEHLPTMVDVYTRALTGIASLTPEDLADWKARAQANYREHQDRVHRYEYEHERRKAEKSLTMNDLTKAFREYDDALESLYQELAA